MHTIFDPVKMLQPITWASMLMLCIEYCPQWVWYETKLKSVAHNIYQNWWIERRKIYIKYISCLWMDHWIRIKELSKRITLEFKENFSILSFSQQKFNTPTHRYICQICHLVSIGYDFWTYCDKDMTCVYKILTACGNASCSYEINK